MFSCIFQPYHYYVNFACFQSKEWNRSNWFPLCKLSKILVFYSLHVFFSKYHSGILATYFTRKKAKIDESLEKFWFIQFEIQFWSYPSIFKRKRVRCKSLSYLRKKTSPSCYWDCKLEKVAKCFKTIFFVVNIKSILFYTVDKVTFV
jgi:hypothetical protein